VCAFKGNSQGSICPWLPLPWYAYTAASNLAININQFVGSVIQGLLLLNSKNDQSNPKTVI